MQMMQVRSQWLRPSAFEQSATRDSRDGPLPSCGCGRALDKVDTVVVEEESRVQPGNDLQLVPQSCIRWR